MIWGKRRGCDKMGPCVWRGGPASQKISYPNNISFVPRLSRIVLIALLSVAAIPFGAPATQVSALESTHDYRSCFSQIDVSGTPTQVIGSDNMQTFRVAGAKTDRDSIWFTSNNNPMWRSAGSFISTHKLTFMQDFNIRLVATVPKPKPISQNTTMNTVCAIGFTKSSILANYTGIRGHYNWNWTRSSAQTKGTLAFNEIDSGGAVDIHDEQTLPSTTPDTVNIMLAYNYAADRATMTVDGVQSTFTGLRAKMGGSAYLYFEGVVNWRNGTDTTNRHSPTDMEIYLTFNSMSLPHLTPAISDISIYRYNDATDTYDIALGKDDTVEPNAIVQVRCKVRNTNSQAGSERFDMHLRLGRSGDEQDGQSFATTGITPFFSRSAGQNYPLLVDGKATYLDESGTTQNLTDLARTAFNEGGGIPLTLVGSTPVEVTYYAHVNQSALSAVVLGQALVEDTFQGTHYEKAELLSQKTLKPGDTDDPTLVPGTDYHYTRLPAANENGWNGKATSPVDVAFYAGDFDEFTVTRDADQSVLSTLTGGQKWTQAADVDALPVTYQARNTATGGTSSKGIDVLRIDTHEPGLSYDAATSALTADDAAPAGSGKETSGIWRVERVKADGRPLAAADVTLQGDAVQALAAGATGTETAADAAGQTSWAFPLADGKGQPAQTVPAAQPGFYVATDAAGNKSAVLEVKAADPNDPGPDKPDPDDPNPDKPDPDNPGGEKPDPDKPNPDGDKPDTPGDNPGTNTPAFPTVTPKPGDDPSGPVPEPLKPTRVETDSSTGLSHATVEDAVTIPTSPEKVTPTMVAQLIGERYTVSSGLDDDRITAGPVRLLDAAGNPTSAIDRSQPGIWYAEQTFTDAAGNTTTIRLTITVRDSVIDGTIGSVGGEGSKSGSADSGSDGGSGGDSHRTALATHISQLPQTGGIFGTCPLHILFVLMAVMASAYSLARLRQNRDSRGRKRRREEIGVETAAAGNPTGQTRTSERERSGLSPFDGLVYSFIALCALAVGLLALCPWDMLLATLTVLVCALWAALLHRRRPAANASSRELASR